MNQPKLTILPWLAWAAILLFLVFGVMRCAQAAPILQASGEGLTIVLYDEDCAMKDKVINLPKRATWTENGKTIDGCWGMSPLRVVILYFADLTAVALPPNIFRPLEGA